MTDEAVAPAHDRRHEHAQVSAEDAEGLHPSHQELGRDGPEPMEGRRSLPIPPTT
jgi:hypothetical protein